MTQSRFDENSSDARTFSELIFGEHLLLLAFVVFTLLGVFLAWSYFGRTIDNPLSRVPASSPIAAVAASNGLPGSTVIQRHTNTTGPTLIGIIAGHKESDSGAVCDDGLTEASVNLKLAELLVTKLLDKGIAAEILDEFDARLTPGYGGTAVVSIHADSCTGPGGQLSGFKTAASSAPDSALLQECIETVYAQETGLAYNVNTITNHMTNYHVFGRLTHGEGALELDRPAIIVEAGFLGGDRDILTNRAEVPASALANGISCFVERVP